MRPDLPPRILAVFLATLVALTPFSIDTYLPAMPAMAIWFNTSVGMVEMTVGAFSWAMPWGSLWAGLCPIILAAGGWPGRG